MERVDLLELEAAGLHHVERVRRRVAHLGAEGSADIAADRHLESRRLQHPAGQRRRRRFALGAGDGDDAAEEPARRKLDLRDHRHAAPARGLHRRLLRRHAGAEDDEIGGREGLRPVAPQLQLHAESCQRLGFRCLAPRVGKRHVRAPAGEQLRGGQAASRGSRDGDAFAGDVECQIPRHESVQRSLSVARLNNAKMIPTMTKRVITFGSLHPLSSKW